MSPVLVQRSVIYLKLILLIKENSLDQIKTSENKTKSSKRCFLKRNFFLAAVVSILLYEFTTLTKLIEKKTRQDLHKNATNYIEQILEVTPHETTAIRALTPHL